MPFAGSSFAMGQKMPDEYKSAFMQLYYDLPREGPGTVDSLLNVLEMANTPVLGRVFDAACGSGADSQTISRALPGAEIIAVDKEPQFIKTAKSRRIHANFGVADMLKPDGLFDLIWSAGAVYFCGVETALEAWQPHLADEGKIAFSEVVWLGQDPSEQAKAFWQENYPEMSSLNGMIGRIEASGFKVIDASPLGRAGWNGYYEALENRAASLEGQNAVLDEIIAELRVEISVFNASFPDYDYVVFLIEPK